MGESKAMVTGDGSNTLFSAQSGEHYHSVFGAIQESVHIFIRAGLDFVSKNTQPVCILEIGFGTGLNALLSYQWAEQNNIPVVYQGIEAFPIESEQILQLNYSKLLNTNDSIFAEMHRGGENKKLGSLFDFSLRIERFEEARLGREKYDVVFFDAFSPESQPEMWTVEGFKKLYDALKPGGVLTTYSCKGSVKRLLKGCGFQIEKIPGPPGKREFLRAVK
jgi:tRNA U34 5-methylaminomethyl-2-thiouridine-forming methyltransferase MnmC